VSTAGTRVRRPAPTRTATLAAAGAGAGLLLSLLLPVAPGYDPWAWLVWGREVVRFELDTTGGPSWKPLPVLVTPLLTPFGDAAPALWLVVARGLGLLALVAAYRLAARLGGRVAGLAAAALLVLTPDGGPRFLRLVLEGHSEPATVAFALFAVERHLAGRPGQALAFGALAGLLRPEAWPFLLLYGAWCWVREPRLRGALVAVLVGLPVLWFGGDWWGSGDPWHGADAAQVAGGGAASRLGLALERAARMVVAPAWVLAAVAVVLGRRRGETAPVVVGAGALAWSGLVAGMATALAYGALGRFYLPAAAAVCVLAGVGVVRLVERRPDRRRATAGILLLVALFGLPRLASLPELLGDMAERSRIDRGLSTVVDEVGRDALLACGPVLVDRADRAGAAPPALAWRLDVPIGAVRPLTRDWSGEGPATVLARTGGRRDGELAGRPATEVGRLVRDGEWTVYAVGCSF
jgi:hypothetical protein